MSLPNPAVVDATSPEATPPPEMHEALALVQRIGGKELLRKVISLFRSTSEQRLAALRAALSGGELQQVSRLAHAMKGSAAQVGAEALRAVSLTLEKEAASLSPHEAAACLEALAVEVTSAWAQLEAYGRDEGAES